MRTASSDFWDAIDAQWQKLTRAKSADDVLRILAPSEVPEETLFSGEGFFAGSGGDKSVMDALYQAGWSVVEAEADYYWCMQAPDGSQITYIEGDVYRGNRISKGGSRRTAYGLSNRFESFSPCESVQHLSADEFSAGADAGRAYYTSGRYDRGEPPQRPEGASDIWMDGFDYGLDNAKKPGWASGPD